MARLGGTIALLVVAALSVAASGGTSAARPSPAFSTFAQTDLPLGQALWTGTSFLYPAENLPQVESADATGAGAHLFTTSPGGLGGEEARCAVPPIAYWADASTAVSPTTGSSASPATARP